MLHRTPTQKMLNDIAMMMYRTPYDNLDPIAMEQVDFRLFEEMEREFEYLEDSLLAHVVR